MAQYGEVRVDFITYTTGVAPNEGNVTVPISGLINAPTFSGDVVIEGDLTVSGLSTFSGITVTGDATIGGDLTVSGDINASGVTISGITGLFASGTEATPSISFVGDTDTGFYNAAANEVRITTSGNDRLTVDDTGNVGIGTTNPGAKLDVKGVSGTYPTQIIQHSTLDTEGEVLRLSRTDSAVRYHSMVARQSATATTGNNYIQFKIHDPSGGQTAQNTVLHLDGTGNVGIGTTDPQAKLDIESVADTPSLTWNNGGQLIVGDTATQLAIGRSNASPFSLYLQGRASNSAARNISLAPEGGNVGIGTTSPNALLEVRNSANSEIRISDTAGGYGNLVYNESGSVSVFEIAADPANTSVPATVLGFSVDGNRVITCRNNGNVGIGTTSPASLLHTVGTRDYTGTTPNTASYDVNLQSGTAFVAIGQSNGIPTIQGHGTGTGYSLALNPNNGNVGIGTTSPGRELEVNGSIQSSSTIYGVTFAGTNDTNTFIRFPGSDVTEFYNGNSESARIDSSGRLLVGTSSALSFASPASTVNIQSFSANPNGLAIVSSTSNVTQDAGSSLVLARRAGGGALTATLLVGSLQYQGFDGTNYLNCASIEAFVDGTPGTNDMPGRLVFSTTPDAGSTPVERMRITSDGNVGIGTTSPSQKLEIYQSSTGAFSTVRIANADGVGLNLAARSGQNVSIYSTSSSDDLLLGTNSTERMRITSDGNVGIGTTSPDELLHIQGDTAEFKGTNTNSINTITGTEQVFKFAIEGQRNAVYGPAGSIIFRQDASTWSSVNANNKPTRIEFCTQDTSTSDVSETPRLVINNLGNVGIGTTNPTEVLNVQGNILATGRIRAKDGTIGDVGLGFEDDHNVGLYRPQSDTLGFVTSSSERARIDSNGKVLINNTTAPTASPASLAKFTITGNTISQGNIGYINLHNSATIANNFSLGAINFTGQGTNGYTGAQIVAVAEGTWTDTSYPTRLVFFTVNSSGTVPAERMSISNEGYIFPDSTSRAQKASIASTVNGGFRALAGGSTAGVRYEGFTTSTGTAYHIAFSNPNGIVGSISTNASATAYNTSSDYRLKENVVPLTGAADRIKQLKPSQFNFIADPATTVDGFLAHEAQAVVPECVTGTKDEVDDEGNPVYQGIDQSKIVPLLTAALQEALTKIESLESRLAALENS